MMIEKIMGVTFKKVRLEILTNPITYRMLELDMYHEGLYLAIEYHGIQHYVFPSFWIKNEKEMEKQLQRDDYKRKVCQLVGIRLITVPYTIKNKDIEAFLRRKLKELKII